MSLRLHLADPRNRRRLRPLLFDLEDRTLLAVGDLRIVTYNIASSGGAPRTGLDTILKAIGDESVNGDSRPIDVLLLQEVQGPNTTTSAVASLMNGLYGAGKYAFGTAAGSTSGSGTQGIVYNTATVQLLADVAFGSVSGTGPARQVLRHLIRPVGTSGTADLYLYNSHYKSDTSSQARRAAEATAIRANSDALGQGINAIYAGDFNLYTSSESAYQTLVSAGNGQAVDPSLAGSWSGSSNAAFRPVFTQAPANSPPGGLTGGGLDDRFDFQLFTSELQDGTGLEYRTGSYHTFGNNGSLPVNSDINSPSNTALAGLPNRTTVLDLLTTVTDHLPVVADYYVVNAQPTVQFTTNAQSVAEAVGSFTVTASLSASTASAVTIPLTFSGSATAPADYSASASSIVIPAGSTTGSITINVVNDAISEADESIVITMGTPTNATPGSTTSQTASILDDDGGALQFSAASYSVNEGNSGTTNAVITVNRTGADLSRSVTVLYRTNGGTATAGTDYVAVASQPLTFLANETSKTFNVAINGDTTVEPNETILLELLGPTGGATLGARTSATLTILDDDSVSPGSLQFAASTASVVEGNGGNTVVTFTVTRTGGSSGAVSVPYSITGGTATSGTDYTFTAGSVSFAAGDAVSKTFTLSVIGDTAFEADETVVLQLGTPTGGATLGSPSSTTLTILNDDAAPVNTLRVASFTPNDSGFVVVFTGAIDASAINLYDTSDHLGAADVTLSRAGETILGNLVVTSGSNKIQFVATGGALRDGLYNVALRSAADGFKSSTGGLLDGNGDGTVGDAYTTTFTLVRAANARLVSVSDVVIGPGQTTAAPIAVTLGDGTGITAMDFRILYDPSLLTVVNAGLRTFPYISGYTASINVFAPGEIRFSFSSTTSHPLPSGPLTLLNITASVPLAAAYGFKTTLQPVVTQLRQGFTSVPPVLDWGVHVGAFVGDVSGDGFQDSFDGFVLNEFAVSNIDGSSAFQNADLNLIGDVTGDGFADSFDGFVLNELAVGNPIPFPLAPTPETVPNFGGGPDPILSLPRGLTGRPGDEIAIPIRLDYLDANPANLVNADVMIGFDPSQIEIVGVREGTLGGGLTTKFSTTDGVLRVALGETLQGRRLRQGDVETAATVVIRIREGASGAIALDLLEKGKVDGRVVSTRLNSGRLELGEAPTNGVDPLDGEIRVAAVDLAVASIASADRNIFFPIPEAETAPVPVAIRRRSRPAPRSILATSV